MAYEDPEDITAKRSAADDDAMRLREDPNVFEEARDRTGNGLGDVRPTVADEKAATSEVASAEVPRTDLAEQGLLPSDSLSEFEARWQEIQIGFVDQPQTAVRDAEALVNDVVSQLTKLFTQERQNLEQNWKRGTEASTEDLRLTLQRYRAFFQRLLAA